MFIAFLSFASSTGLKAQCVDIIESSVDCCVRIAIYADCGSGSTLIGYISDGGTGGSSFCSDACYIPHGTTSGPVTGSMQFKSGVCAGVLENVTDYCNAHPSCTLSFVITNSTGGSTSIPSSGSVDFDISGCCGQTFHAEISGGTL